MRIAGNQKRKTLRSDFFVALLCGAFVVLMGGLSCAAVPLYSWFCRASGGRTEVAGAPRLSTVRFDTGLAAGLPFRPPRAGLYFEKIDCFAPQMQPGESRHIAVVVLYPKLADDPGRDAVSTITLSYTFYPARLPDRI